MNFKWECFWAGLAVMSGSWGFVAGYQYPRDLEIESTKPIELHYEITPEAARLLVLKFSKGLEVKP